VGRALLPADLPAERVAARIGLISDTPAPGRCPALPPTLEQVLGGVDLILHARDLGELLALDRLVGVRPPLCERRPATRRLVLLEPWADSRSRMTLPLPVRCRSVAARVVRRPADPGGTRYHAGRRATLPRAPGTGPQPTEGQRVRITEVKVFTLEGRPRSGLALYEIPRGGRAAGEATPHRWTFTEVHTDEGLVGLTHGGSAEVKAAGRLLLGEDPTRTEYLWEKLYAALRPNVRPVALLDLALWDLLGKIRGLPVYALLGGPTRERVRAYAAMLGFATEPARAAAASVEYVEQGFSALKWYLPHNALDGEEGLRQNVALIEAVREAVGPDVDVMVDCLLSDPRPNSVLYAIKLARALEPYRPAWLEEPLAFDDLDAHRRLAEATRIPLAFGEHYYTRWQIKDAIERGAPAVVQPDPNAAGGITELRKIIALASTYGVVVAPHANESCRNNLHLLFAQPERLCPWGEWGVRINHDVQYFWTDFYQPVRGFFPLPGGPGFGYALDPEKIVRRVEL
jgi:L-alanine-DL-glutamate epimerase-like enolase superfamily enzyme